MDPNHSDQRACKYNIFITLNALRVHSKTPKCSRAFPAINLVVDHLLALTSNSRGR